MSDVCPKCGAKRKTEFPPGGEPSERITVFVCGTWTVEGEIREGFLLDCLRRQLASEKALREKTEELAFAYDQTQSPTNPVAVRLIKERDELKETNRNNVACAEAQVGDLTKRLEKAEAELVKLRTLNDFLLAKVQKFEKEKTP